MKLNVLTSSKSLLSATSLLEARVLVTWYRSNKALSWSRWLSQRTTSNRVGRSCDQFRGQSSLAILPINTATWVAICYVYKYNTFIIPQHPKRAICHEIDTVVS